MSGDFLPKRVERYPRDRPLCVSFECDSSSEELEKKERREEISGSGFTHGSGASLFLISCDFDLANQIDIGQYSSLEMQHN